MKKIPNEENDAVSDSSSDGNEIGVQENGMKVEVLIRRIMKRAEAEDKIRRAETAVLDAKRKKARQEAIGMGGMAADDKQLQMQDMSLDMELRTRPWNSRSYSDRSDILYQTLFRPFTKNV